jgi:hypothetical protein
MQGDLSQNFDIMMECMNYPSSVQSLKPSKASYLIELFTEIVKNVITKVKERGEGKEENLQDIFTADEIDVFRNIEKYVKRR